MIIPAGLTYSFGRMIGNRRQGWALYAAMLVVLVVAVGVVYAAEQHGSPAQHHAGVLTGGFDGSTGGNLEGKEQRFGITDSALWAAITTVTSCGAVNSAHDSLHRASAGLVPLVNMSTGEVVFGGVGSGLYYMLLFVLLTVFIAGLMVGRTPEFLGKKIESREMKLVLAGVLVTPLAVLVTTAWGWRPITGGTRSTTPARRASRSRSTPTCRRPTTTAPPSPATPATCSPTRPATSAPTGSPSPTCSAA